MSYTSSNWSIVSLHPPFLGRHHRTPTAMPLAGKSAASAHCSMSAGLLLHSRGRQPHLGVTTMTLWPRCASAMGKDPTTSPKPPVLLQGAASAETNIMSIVFCALGAGGGGPG